MSETHIDNVIIEDNKEVIQRFKKIKRSEIFMSEHLDYIEKILERQNKKSIKRIKLSIGLSTATIMEDKIA